MPSTIKALCLLALVVIVAIASAAAKPLPGSCLMAASTLCANADTNAMRCLTKLAMKRDARVPTACAEAIMPVNPSPKQAHRAKRMSRMSRMLSEGGCTGNSCGNNFASARARCNDVNHATAPCNCGNPPAVITQSRTRFQVVSSSANANRAIACSNICCRADPTATTNGSTIRDVCCMSDIYGNVYCGASTGTDGSNFCSTSA